MPRTRKTDDSKGERPAKRPRATRRQEASANSSSTCIAPPEETPAPAPRAQPEPETEIVNPLAEQDTQSEPSVPVEPMSAILARYKAWKLAGSPHDTICFECSKPDELYPCKTCRRSYHWRCMSPDTKANYTYGSPWFCAVCLARGWREKRPVISPPVLPWLNASSYPAGSTPDPPEVPVRAGAEETSTAARASNAPGPPPVITRSTTQQPQSQDSLRPIVVGTRGRHSSNARTPAPSGPRKSRFNTLSEEVDSALWVVYRELEGVPLLKQQITDLQSEVLRLRQELNITRNELALSKRAVERSNANVSEAELHRLRADAADKEKAVEEAERLGTINAELTLDNGDLREELDKSNASLREWRARLASMLGESG
ncbi:uncharacterized protein BDV14DRAFT_197698 [Aspergillus stella-maris]|uniref:uncharacterized protein n=1 Tax=Aspergillus stella-maris TaxID=1810926 RepID=UPI003CCE1EF6